MLRAKSFFYNEVPEIELYPLDKTQDLADPTDEQNPIEIGRQIFLRYRGKDDNTYQWLGHQYYFRSGCVFPSVKDIIDGLCWLWNWNKF
mgnify:CR=1 FL=1|jgi:hypothetical protein|tara:strand:- start:961 stop:1227 length:267 start_codon:yes stop_codon:yes gene_type:complete